MPPWLVPLCLIVLVFALRAALLGNPNVYLDEQFYLLIGERMRDGAWPYIDIWDRKPILLFLVTAVAAIFGDGVLAYQSMAAISVALTTLLLYRLALRFTTPLAAGAAAAFYPIFATLLLGGNGQSPLFYNLLTVAAGAIVFRLIERGRACSARSIFWLGLLAMLLIGLAMQIKYSPLPLGIALGLVLQYLAWRRVGTARTLAMSMAWIAAALLPTALAFGVYAAHGAGQAFWFANFESILLRDAEPYSVLITRLLTIIGIMTLPTLLGLWGYVTYPASDAPWLRRFVVGWVIVEWISLLLFGSYFQHYALPLLPPTALLLSLVGGSARVALWGLVGAAAVAGQAKMHREVAPNGGPIAIDRMVAAMDDGRNCPFIYDGPVAVYHIGQFCLPTRYPFTAHLSRQRENDAFGVSSKAEVTRIMDRRPDYVMMEYPQEKKVDRQTAAVMRERLSRDYKLVFHIAQRRGRVAAIYRLKDGVAPRPNAVGPVPRRD